MEQKEQVARQIAVFFYGSFIRRDVMARGGLVPDRIEVARLSGFEIHICPHACIAPSDQHSIYGILVWATHDQLRRMYSMDGVGVFLPEAVLVETANGCTRPAMCYIPPARGDEPADVEYLDHLIAAGREHGFPTWYLERLATLGESSPAA
ncbi:gamma-glutamylcyclotransferase [Schlegelella sp. S2-27]|uniref:Gamma-glutamylcyclotransferase n=1 Tax=Caldimonas mangrovi TaxID=2944811 RepID=A0ABT0YSR0_9BURK|nr:gamma-glutamylcyclotransferase family protein [Caldimonas mangrovi]MCM5681777.1 gamma-glutamylcyclotransferase [Caldimonas mangrovi]